jgi:hypothetical protein
MHGVLLLAGAMVKRESLSGVRTAPGEQLLDRKQIDECVTFSLSEEKSFH